MRRFAGPMLGVCGLLAVACGGGEESAADTGGAAPDAGGTPDSGGATDAGAPDTGLAECLYSPETFALEKTHKVESGVGILPSGRAITPEGIQIPIGLFPGNMAMTPDGKTLIISNNGYGGNSVVLVDTAQKTVRQTIPTPENWLFYGLAVSPDGKRFYAAGGTSAKVFAYSLDDAGLGTLEQTIETRDGYPTGLAISRDGSKLYVTHYTMDVVGAYDTASGALLKSGSAGKYPFGLALSADGAKLYVSNWGQRKAGDDPAVTVLDAETLARKATITVGKNPEMILDDTAHGRLFVLNSDQETVSAVDPATDTVSQTISLLSAPDAPTGVFPLSAALSPDAQTLYVAAAAKDTVEVVDLAAMKVKGSIPVGWYPNAVAVSPDGKSLYALNAKGEGSGPNEGGQYIAEIMTGTLSILDTPDDARLSDLTAKAAANNLRPTTFFAPQCEGAAFAIPMRAGEESPIKHVIFVLKENRTFDQVFGDFEGAERDPSLLMFGEEVTPNAHKLAREFTLLDNFYTESEISVQGHLWATGMAVNDYSERTWIVTYRGSTAVYPLSGVEPATSPLNPFVFRHLLNNGISFVDYGQIVGMGGENENVLAHWDQKYPGMVFNTGIKDVVKAQYVVDRINEGFLPAFTYMLLPNDHTSGTSPGAQTPESMVADNDEGLGILVEGVSKSRFWDSTLIFVTEDDPQDGADHVDAHRTLALVISPYARKGYISKVHHSFASFYATWERILHAPPLNIYDANAAPLLDCFTNIPDLTPYTHESRRVPEAVNTFLGPFAAESAKLDFSVPDNAPGLQKILWHYVKGKDQPFPGRDGD
ncbi:MAG: hypothetical protein HY897_14410 [Deltaproteobacteria bacterium]|nr:hypothetical protein [Deltaproteobacteria bacterium]